MFIWCLVAPAETIYTACAATVVSYFLVFCLYLVLLQQIQQSARTTDTLWVASLELPFQDFLCWCLKGWFAHASAVKKNRLGLLVLIQTAIPSWWDPTRSKHFSTAATMDSLCHYPGDMDRRMRKVLGRPWVGADVCHLFLLFNFIAHCFFKSNSEGFQTKWWHISNMIFGIKATVPAFSHHTFL